MNRSGNNSTTPPHLIFLLTDQQRSDTIAALGHSHMITPHMDQLASDGVAFDRAYCAGATCAPSRAAIFTGMYAHNTGAYSFNNWGHHRTWVESLAEGGYWCANVGKMHFIPRDVRGGFHERIVVENPTSISNWGSDEDDAWGRYLAFHGKERPNHRHRKDPSWKEKRQGVPWEWEEHLHSDVFTANSAIAWIRAHQPDRPLFLQVGFPGPHEPWDAPERWVSRYMERRDTFPSPVNGSLVGKPPQHEATRAFHSSVDHESRIDLAGATTDEIRRMQAHYYAKISLVDEQIGRILAALDERGFLENALVVLSSDHGEHLADHGLVYKWLMHESVVRVPLVFWEKTPRHLKPGRRPELASLIDLGPTLLDYAGIGAPTQLEGISLRSSLAGQKGSERDAVFCEDNYMLMMRTSTHKLVHYFGQSAGELYDVQQDPGETRNLWDSPEHQDLKKDLQLRLLEWMGTSCYITSGYKQGETTKPYPLRWPTCSAPALHGDNLHPKPKDLFC
jgi:arylsulfatase